MKSPRNNTGLLWHPTRAPRAGGNTWEGTLVIAGQIYFVAARRIVHCSRAALALRIARSTDPAALRFLDDPMPPGAQTEFGFPRARKLRIERHVPVNILTPAGPDPFGPDVDLDDEIPF